MSEPSILSPEDFDRIIAALSLMQDVDDEQGHADEARKTRDLVDRIRQHADQVAA